MIFPTFYQKLATLEKYFVLGCSIGKMVDVVEKMDGELAKYSDEWFNELYLKYGSVEEAVRSYEDNLPISVANYHRLVTRYGLVKSAGRHVSLPETLHFFRLKAMKPGEPLERIYARMSPSFQTSLSTLHRIYQYMEKAIVRRYAAALIVSPVHDSEYILVGKEVFGNTRYGKNIGDFSIPMSFAKKDEPNFDSALRVLQQEVFAKHASCGQLTRKSELARTIIPADIEPFFHFDIVDVRVKVFKVNPPENYQQFSSFKLVEHSFTSLADFYFEKRVRVGVNEIIKLYGDYLHNPFTIKFPPYHVSSINALALAYLPVK